MIKPTVGRNVHFRNGEDGADEQAQAAIVTYVHSDNCVNLYVFGHSSGGSHHNSVKLLQDGEGKPESGEYAEWMPYQKQVAAGEIEPTQHVR